MTASPSPTRRRSSTPTLVRRLRPPRTFLLLALVAIVCLSLFHIYYAPSELAVAPVRQRTPRSLQHAFAGPSSSSVPGPAGPEAAASISLRAVLDRIDADIARSAASCDTELYDRQLGVKLGSTSAHDYRQGLSETLSEFFTSPTAPPAAARLLDDVVARLSRLPRPAEPLPNFIYTTDLRSPDQFPEQFKSWSEQNPDWQAMFVEDDAIEGWVAQALGPDAGVLQELRALRGARGVLRADLFRYLVLLLNGGVYTDTDTACVRPISQWALSPDRPTIHPLLGFLPTLLELSRADDSRNDDAEAGSEADANSEGNAETPMTVSVEDDSPALVIALEADAPDLNTDWRKESFVRGIQVVQWTVQAKRAHPILLDVLGHGLREARRVREAEASGEEGLDVPEILDWTGPGAFTDAVMRYLLIQHGVHPERLSGLKQPVRFGDVVVMPVHSFRADASEGEQGDHRVVWHGFFGRWKQNQ